MWKKVRLQAKGLELRDGVGDPRHIPIVNQADAIKATRRSSLKLRQMLVVDTEYPISNLEVRKPQKCMNAIAKIELSVDPLDVQIVQPRR